ncbi:MULTISPECIES: ferritin-like domain-containing protein [Geobacter]|uniref:ferritin-like domain-containing protein n=1 Tax=Geobacter TaxID=28231 RepID=UPI0025729DC7|nr:ferritin family protein [Geobacter sulfurreducens]BEH08724.1 ferritin family protein [Geobacter sulfurreducens subsp. ethanolicus]BET60211.1 ferritin family protein [Geobacter sp. 60473]
MSEQGAVCYTFEAAVEMAITMEEEGFRHYLDAIRRVKNKGAKQILKEAALDELEHKLSLEKALLEGQMEGAGSMERQIPTMNLGYVLAKKELSPESDAREALAYAIHLEKGAIDFYQRMAQGCVGAPMAKLFDRLLVDETKHLQQLEDMYEQHFMTEN